MSIRAIFILMVIVGSVPFIFRRPYLGLLPQIYLFLHPFHIWYGPSFLRPIFIFTILTIIFYIIKNIIIERKKVHFTKEILLFILLSLLLYMSSKNAQFSIELSFKKFNDLLKLFVFVFLMLNLLVDFKKINVFIWTMIGSCVYLAMKAVKFYITYGVPRVDNIEMSQGGANELAKTMILILPFIFYKIYSENKKERYIALFSLPIIFAALVTTGSRAGMISLAALFVFTILKTPKRVKILLGTVALSFLTLPLIPSDYIQRMKTITTYEEDVSAVSRLTLWNLGIEVWKKYPILGVGLNNFNFISANLTSNLNQNNEISNDELLNDFQANSKRGLKIHNMYIQLLAEGGTFVFIVFMMIILLIYWQMTKIRKFCKSNIDNDIKFYFLSTAIQLSLLGILINTIFGDVIYFDMFYWTLGIGIAINKTFQTQQQRGKK